MPVSDLITLLSLKQFYEAISIYTSFLHRGFKKFKLSIQSHLFINSSGRVWTHYEVHGLSYFIYREGMYFLYREGTCTLD